MIENYVFGYGSLMGDWLGEEGSYIANLEGFTRNWRATMDNRVLVPGYKIYKTVDGGNGPDFVSFLNISEEEDADAITGMVKHLSLAELARLDRRERNYLRVDVTDRIKLLLSPTAKGPPKPYKIWAYTASPAALKRFSQIGGKPPVVSQEYYDQYKETEKRLVKRTRDRDDINFEIGELCTLQPLEKKQL